MDQNTYNLCQVIMWAVGIQTLVIGGILSLLWVHMNSRFDKVDQKFEVVADRFDKADVKLQVLSDRILIIETTLSNKEGCHFHEPKHLKEAQ